MFKTNYYHAYTHMGKLWQGHAYKVVSWLQKCNSSTKVVTVRTEVIITEFIVSHFYQICFFGSHNRSVCVLVIKPTIGYYEYGYFDSVIRISHSMYTCVCVSYSNIRVIMDVPDRRRIIADLIGVPRSNNFGSFGSAFHCFSFILLVLIGRYKHWNVFKCSGMSTLIPVYL